MESKTKLLGHPVHPMLVVFPLGLLSASVAFDAAHVLTKKKELAQASYWMLASGLIGGVAAGPFGARDWLAIPDGTRAKQIGLWHGLGNAVVSTLFGASWLLRKDKPEKPSAAAVALSLMGSSLSLATAWLGGELSYRLGVGVSPGAHLDSPSSLSDESATADVSNERRDRDVVYLPADGAASTQIQ